MARLSSKWWAKTQPAKFRGTLLKSIQDFETAVKTKNTAQIYESIFTMRNEMSFDRNLLRKHLRADPAKLKSVLGELDDLETLFTREEKSLAKNGASEIKVWSRDFSDAIAKVYSSGHIRLDGGTVELKLDLATIHAIENIGAEARLFRELNDLFDDAVDSSCKDIELAMKTQNGQPLKKLQMMSLHDQAKKRLANLQKDLIKSANGAAAKAASQHKAAKAYKKKKVVDVSVATLSVAGSAAGVALPGTTAVAAVMLARSIASLAQEIASLCLSLEKKYQRVLINIKALEKAYKKGRSGKEVAKISVNAVLGADVLTTHSSCVTHFEDYVGTLNVVADRVRMQQKDILKTIRKLDVLTKAMDKLAIDGTRYKKSQLARSIANTQKSLDKTLNKASDTMARVAQAEKASKPLEIELKKLGDNSKAVQIAEKVIPLCVNLAFSIGSFGDGVNASKEAATITVGTLGLLVDIQGEITDLFG